MGFEQKKASSELKNASAEHAKGDIHATIFVDDHDLPKPKIAPKSMEEGSFSTSSSSSTLSDEDFFQIDTSELSKPKTRIDGMTRKNLQSPFRVVNTQLEADPDFAGKYEVKNTGQNERFTSGPVWSGKVPTGMPFSPYVYGGSPGCDNFGTIGAKQSPPAVQLMGRCDVPDPNRIPSSIFAGSKSTVPREWSVASNESLFSIHMEKSGDLTSLYSSQLNGYPSISPLSASSPAKSVGVVPALQQTIESEAANAEAMKDVLKATRDKHVEKNKPITFEGIPHSDSASQFSDGGSVNSYRSFAFPILIPEGRNGSLQGESVQPFKNEQQLQQPLPQSESAKADHPEVESPKANHPEVESPKAKRVARQRTWLTWSSCFSCCLFCH